MPVLQPYLVFNGNCEEAFNFYKSVFGGEFGMISRFSDIPAEFAHPEAEKDKIIHISLAIGKSSVLMGSDSPEAYGTMKNGDTMSVFIETDSASQADSFFAGLAEGGRINMPMADTFWGSWFGMVTDKYGINWMISYQKPQN
ncbi:MAG: VOC family protein [Ignavibacteriaceae bacterium]|nr:VOC family protein [Ignavibacteriaceae bacterium]